MRIITVHGLDFGVESDAWGKHDNERDWAIDDLTHRMSSMTAAEVASLHTGLIAFMNGDADDDAEAMALCAEAAASATKEWHDPTAASLCLTAQ